MHANYEQWEKNCVFTEQGVATAQLPQHGLGTTEMDGKCQRTPQGPECI